MEVHPCKRSSVGSASRKSCHPNSQGVANSKFSKETPATTAPGSVTRDLLISTGRGDLNTSGMLRQDGSQSPSPRLALPHKSSSRVAQTKHLQTSPELTPQRQLEWGTQDSDTPASQYALLRDQLTTFSREVISLRSEMHLIKNMEAQLREQIYLEKTKREDLIARVDVSVRSLQEQLGTGLRTQRAAASEEYEQELTRLRLALEEESQLRTSNARKLEAALRQELREQTARSADEVWQALQKESRERSTADEELAEKTKALADQRQNKLHVDWQSLQSYHQAAHSEALDIRQALEAEVKARIQSSEESRLLIGELKLSLQDEAHARKQSMAEQDRLTAELQKLQQRHAADLSGVADARAAADEIGRLMMKVKEDMGEFKTGHQDLCRLVQDASGALDLERTEREFADSSVKSQISSCLQDLVAEREARLLETATLRGSLETLSSHVMQQLREVKADMEDQAARGNTATELLDNQVAELRHELSTERGKTIVFLEERLKAFSHSLDSEIGERVAGDEEAARLALEARNWAERELGSFRQALRGFESQVAQQHEQTSRTAADGEVDQRRREAALERLLSDLSNSLDVEKQRLDSLQGLLEQADRDSAGQLRKLELEMEQERQDRDLADTSLQAAMMDAQRNLGNELKRLHDGHVSSVREFEDRFCGELQQLSAELIVKHGEMRDLLNHTSQEESALRQQAEERIMKCYEDLRSKVEIDMQQARAASEGELEKFHQSSGDTIAALREAQEFLQSEFANHMTDMEDHIRHVGSLEEAHAALQSELNIIKTSTAEALAGQRRLHDGHVTSMQEMEARVRAELQQASTEHVLKHGEMRDWMKSSLEDSHTSMVSGQTQLHKERAASEQELEDRICSQLQQLKVSMQDAFDRQKDGHIASMQELEESLRAELQQLSEECRGKQAKQEELRKRSSILRVQAEDQLGRVSGDLRINLETTMKETLAAMRSEVAEIGKSNEGTISELQEAHRALQDEFATHKSQIEDALGGQKKLHDGSTMLLNRTFHDLEERLRAELQQVSEEHNAQLSRQQELRRRSSILRVQAEDRLGRVSDDLRNDVESTMKEALSALRVEVAELSTSNMDTMSAMQEAHAVLQGELATLRMNVEEEIGAQRHLHDGHAVSMKELEDRICGELQQVSEMHQAKEGELKELMKSFYEAESSLRTQAEERVGKVCDDLRNDFEITRMNAARRVEVVEHNKVGMLAEIKQSCEDNKLALQEAIAVLQSELGILKASVDDLLGRQKALHDGHATSLQELESRIRGELQLSVQSTDSTTVYRTALESVSTLVRANEKLDQIAEAADSELATATGEELAALRAEMAELRKSSVVSTSTMQETSELARLQHLVQSLEGQMTTKIQVMQVHSEKMFRELLDMERSSRKEADNDLLSKLSDIEERLTQAIDELSDNHEALHSKFESKSRELHSGIEAEKRNRRLSVAIDNKMSGIQKDLAQESDVRTEAEQRLGRACTELRSKLEETIREVHKSFGAELAEHVQSSREMMLSVQDAQAALRGELAAHRKLHDGLAGAIGELEEKLREELQQVSDEHHEKHLVSGELLGEMRDLISSVNEETQARYQRAEKAREEGLRSLQEQFRSETKDCVSSLDAKNVSLRDYVEQELLQNFKQDVKELMAAQDSLNESLSAEVAARLKEETQSRIEGDQAMGRNFGIEVKRLETEMSNACAELKKEMQTLTESVEGQANSRASGVGLTARLFDEESCRTSEASAGVLLDETVAKSISEHPTVAKTAPLTARGATRSISPLMVSVLHPAASPESSRSLSPTVLEASQKKIYLQRKVIPAEGTEPRASLAFCFQSRSSISAGSPGGSQEGAKSTQPRELRAAGGSLSVPITQFAQSKPLPERMPSAGLPMGSRTSIVAPAFGGRSLSPPVIDRRQSIAAVPQGTTAVFCMQQNASETPGMSKSTLATPRMSQSTSTLPGTWQDGVSSAPAASAAYRRVPSPVQRQGSVPTLLQRPGCHGDMCCQSQGSSGAQHNQPNGSGAQSNLLHECMRRSSQAQTTFSNPPTTPTSPTSPTSNEFLSPCKDASADPRLEAMRLATKQDGTPDALKPQVASSASAPSQTLTKLGMTSM